MFELSGVNYEEVLEQGDSILVLSYREFELSGVRVIGIILYIYYNFSLDLHNKTYIILFFRLITQ